MYSVEINNLSRVFKNSSQNSGSDLFWALRGVNLNIGEGIIYGVLGPNGAGKTTLINIMATLLLPTAGTVKIAGFNVENEFKEIRPIINMVTGGENSGYGILTLLENLWMFSQFYGIERKTAVAQIMNLLEIFGIADKAHTQINKLSAGMRQKMNFIRGFITNPRILFLDEPTLGLDVVSARETRKFVSDWVKKSDAARTVILTTHYMQEADELCDEIAVIDKGEIIKSGTPADIKSSQIEGYRYKISVSEMNIDSKLFGGMSGIKSISLVEEASSGLSELVFILENECVLSEIIKIISEKKYRIINITKYEYTLEEAFVSLTGKK
ncbi:MAG: ABC transporter ATP-binding protein [Candidatus Wallbacteria bacterium]